MALEFGFFNSQNHDRAYSAEDFSRIFDGIINDGIFDSIGDHFAVTATGNMRDIRVGSGRAWLNSTWTWNTTDYPIRLDNVTNNIYQRIDAICIKVDHSDPVRANSIAVVRGEQGTEPEKPEIPADDIEAGIHYHVIAYVTVSYDTVITNAEIENMVGMENGTPYVTGILATTSVDELWNQWDGEFNNWWENIKNILDTDTVTRLQNEIDHLKPSADTIRRYFPTVEAAGYYPTDAILKELSLNPETWGKFFAEGEMPSELRYNALFNKISSLLNVLDTGKLPAYGGKFTTARLGFTNNQSNSQEFEVPVEALPNFVGYYIEGNYAGGSGTPTFVYQICINGVGISISIYQGSRSVGQTTISVFQYDTSLGAYISFVYYSYSSSASFSITKSGITIATNGGATTTGTAVVSAGWI